MRLRTYIFTSRINTKFRDWKNSIFDVLRYGCDIKLKQGSSVKGLDLKASYSGLPHCARQLPLCSTRHFGSNPIKFFHFKGSPLKKLPMNRQKWKDPGDIFESASFEAKRPSSQASNMNQRQTESRQETRDQPGNADNTKNDPELATKTVDLHRLFSFAKNESHFIVSALVAQAVASTSALFFPMAFGKIVDILKSTESWHHGESKHHFPSSPTGVDVVVNGQVHHHAQPPAHKTRESFIDTLTSILGTAPDHEFTIVLTTLAVVTLVSAIAAGLRTFMSSLASERLSNQLKTKLYAAILAQETAYFDSTRSGELVNRLANDASSVAKTLTDNILRGARASIVAVSSLTFALYLSPQLSLISLAMLPPVFFFTSRYKAIAKTLSKNLLDQLAEATQIASEKIGSLRTVRLFGAEDSEFLKYSNQIDKSYAIARRIALYEGLFLFSSVATSQFLLITLLSYGANLVSTGAITVGSLTSFMMYGVNFSVSVASIATVLGQISKAQGSAARIFEILDRMPAERVSTLTVETNTDPTHNQTRKRSASNLILPHEYFPIVDFRNVWFTYPSDPNLNILSGVDLTLRPGEVVAIAGASGSGKSTLMNLLTRLYTPTEGCITLDNTDITKLEIKWYRQQLAVVPQEPLLFGGTIAENISYGNQDGSLDDVKKAAHYAVADTIINKLPYGYHTNVAERGMTLSGGQKQRIALARAFYKKPRILVLDEATSALDNENENLVSTSIEEYARNKNIVIMVIAHRLSTLQKADRIFVLQDGHIVQDGTFDELLLVAGAFRSMVSIPKAFQRL